jgi:hypothetical protein
VSSGGTFHPRELFRALARHGVEYVTVGGVAIQAHGAQRLTQDLDVAIAASKDNLDRLAAALSDVDARILGPDGQRSRSVPSAAMLADLLRMKRASVRPQDLADVRLLESLDDKP